MYGQQSQWIIEVCEREFSEKVLQASQERPVLVDFWASWCAPCRLLAPVLEKLAEEFRGAFILARVNTEGSPALAYQFQIRSIPYVMLFKNGEPVDQFIGALPETEIRKFLRPHCTTDTDRLVLSGREKLTSGDLEGAERHFQEALRQEPSHPEALLGLARLAWTRGSAAEAEGYLREIDPASEAAEEMEILKAEIWFRQQCEEFGDPQSLDRRTEQGSDDLETLYRLGCCRAAEGDYGKALETFLEIVARDRSFRNEEPRKAMLEIFKIVGNRSPLAEEYRSRLARTIF